MAVSLGEKAETESAKIALVKKDKLWYKQREASRTFQVVSSLTEDYDQICGAVGVPQIGTLYRGMVVMDHDAREVSPIRNPITGLPGLLWDVTAKLTNDISYTNANEDENPLYRRPICKWRCETVDEALPRDVLTGDSIATAAGEPLVVTGPSGDYIREVTRYELFPFDPTVFLGFHNRISATEFYGAPVGTAWLYDIETDEEDVNGDIYEHVTYRIRFRLREDPDNPGQFAENTWKGTALNYGNYARPFPGLPAERVIDRKTGEPMTVNLDEDGTILPEGQPAIYLAFNRFAYADLNQLNPGPFS